MPRQLDDPTGDSKNSAATFVQTIGTLTYSNSPAIFMIQALTVSATCATVGGLAAGLSFAGTYGGAISFLGGSVLGFASGACWHYVTLSQRAVAFVTEFPELMRYHILNNYRDQESQLRSPSGWHAWRLEAFGPHPELGHKHWWRNFTDGSPLKRSQAMASTYSASSAIAAIKEAQEEAIVQRYTAKIAGGEGSREEEVKEEEEAVSVV